MLPDAAFADNILEKTIRRGEEESEKTDMKTARIIDVCISEKKGVQKVPAERIEMRPDWGIEGDAHAGNWHRQVSLLAQESVDHLQRLLTKIRLKPGDFGENIVTEGIVLYELPVGTRMRIGTALAEVTQIGKECHQGCAIRQAAGDCVMPREGIFVKILEPGVTKKGDMIELLEESAEAQGAGGSEEGTA